MSTVIVLSNQDIRAIVGSVRGKKIVVERAYHAQAPEGCMINGQIIHEEEFMKFVSKFIADNKLPKKDVTIVLGSVSEVNRNIQLPKMSEKKTLECIAREFASVERTKDPVYGYTILPGQQETPCGYTWLPKKQGRNKEKSREMIASMVERGSLEPHLARVKSAKIKVNSISLVLEAQMALFGRLSYLKEAACVVQVLEGINVLNMLFDGGRYIQFTRTRVFGDRGTPAFGVECARAVSNMQQFLKTQHAESEIAKVYLCGEFAWEDYDICQESMTQMNGDLEVQMLKEDSKCGISFPEGVEFGQYVTAVGALLIPKGRSNLLYQFQHDPESVQRRRELVSCLLPPVLVFAACAAGSIALGMVWFARADEVAWQYEYMSSPLITQQVAEYDQMETKNQEIDTAILLSGDSWRYLISYPVFSSATRQLIEACADELGTAAIISYEANSGNVKLEVSASEAEHLYQIVGRLEERTDVIAEVFYSGFNYDERAGAWKAMVNVCLRGTENTEQEVAP